MFLSLSALWNAHQPHIHKCFRMKVCPSSNVCVNTHLQTLPSPFKFVGVMHLREVPLRPWSPTNLLLRITHLKSFFILSSQRKVLRDEAASHPDFELWVMAEQTCIQVLPITTLTRWDHLPFLSLPTSCYLIGLVWDLNEIILAKCVAWACNIFSLRKFYSYSNYLVSINVITLLDFPVTMEMNSWGADVH